MNCPKCGCYIARRLDCCPACGHGESFIEKAEVANTAIVYKDTGGNATCTKYVDIDSLKNYQNNLRNYIDACQSRIEAHQSYIESYIDAHCGNSSLSNLASLVQTQI